MERTHRKVYRGVVVSDKNDKTITVVVNTSKRHTKYDKRVKFTTKFTAHDENNEAHVGDTVEIMATRPLSATKRFRLIRVVEKAIVL
ncbi:MAG: 30S ribosomal protein S17 [Erysipelotrichaceae bacterium]|nr:30S ribosomal protein S17 [Erysipelotrichaceae bacterium]